MGTDNSHCPESQEIKGNKKPHNYTKSHAFVHMHSISPPCGARRAPAGAQLPMARTAALGPASLLPCLPHPCLAAAEANWDEPELQQLTLDGNLEALRRPQAWNARS